MIIQRTKPPSWPAVLVASLLLGCTSTDKDPPDADLWTDEDGEAQFSLVVPSGAQTVQLGVHAPDEDGFFRLISLIDPDGDEVLASLEPSERAHQNVAQRPAGLTTPVLTINHPFHEEVAVQAGTWTAEVQLIDDAEAPAPDILLMPFVVTNEVPVSERHILAIQVRTAVGLIESEEDALWLEEVLFDTTQVFATVGIDLEITVQEADWGPAVVPPFEGGAVFEEHTAAAEEILVVIGQSWTDGSEYRGGQVGAVPLPLIPTAHSALAIAIEPHRMEFQEHPVATTLIHELGHVLGLVHTVDFEDSMTSLTDALEDTEECEEFWDCLDDAAVCTNAMFPASDCVEARVPDVLWFSDGQAQTMRRFTGLR